MLRFPLLCLTIFPAVLALADPAHAAGYRVGSFVKTSGASQAVPHGLGIVPKAIVLWTEGKTDESFAGGSLFALGATDGATSASTATGALDAAAPTYASNRFASKVLTIVDGGGATLAEADLSAWDATTFTLSWTTNDANGYVVHFMAIGGSDVSAKVVLWNAPLVTGNLAVNTVGFQPDVVIHSMTRQVSSPSTGTEGSFVLGVSAGTGANQWSNSIYSSGASPSTTQRAQSNAASLYMVRSGALVRQAAFVSMNPTGFTLNHTTVDASRPNQVFSLALKGMPVSAGAFTKSAGAAPVSQSVTTAGVAPRLVFLSSVQNTSAAGAVAEAPYGIGASDGASEGSSAFQDQTAQTPSNVDGIDKTSKVFVKVNNATQTIDAEADMLGFTENGFVLDWTTNDGLATQIPYLALGDVATFYRSIGTAAAYVQGTVTVTRGSTTVTGGGATPPDWTPTAGNRGRGDRITITGQGTFTVLAVNSATSLTLSGPFTGTTGTYTYSIARAFTGPETWYTCVAGGAACGGSANLVTSRRKEVGVMYKEGHAAWTGSTWNGTTTSPTYDITLTADPGNRHLGAFGGGAIFNQGGNSIRPYDSYMTFEWLEFRNGSPRGFHISRIATPNKLTFRFCLFHSSVGEPLNWFSDQHDADVYNNIFWGSTDPIQVDFSSTVNIYNNTFYNVGGAAVAATSGSNVTLYNNIAIGCSGNCYAVTTLVGTSSNNIASDTAALATHSPTGGGINGLSASASPITCSDPQGCVGFLSLAATPNLHLITTTGYPNQAFDSGVDLSASIAPLDIDRQVRGGSWDRGADELDGTTAVELTSFEATGGDGSVDLTWQTGSELHNLGFHLYRSLSAEGPYERITASVIPGLGSSPVGASYSYLDAGLANGVTYFYRLEDIETTGKTKLHGPVQATPHAGSAAGEPPPGGGGSGSGEGSGSGGGGDPGGGPGSSGGGGDRVAYGDPSLNALRVRREGPQEAVVELITEGFYAVRQGDGTVRLELPGFEELGTPGAPAVPSRRVWLEAVAGRGVELASVRALEVAAYPDLRLSAVGTPQLEMGPGGTVKAGRRRRGEDEAFRRSGLYPAEAARVVEAAFQGDVKKAQVHLAPVRWDGASQQLLLARRLVVRVRFDGEETGETPFGGARGRREGPGRFPTPRGLVLAQLVTRAPGVYRVRYEDVFDARSRGRATSELRLSRQGETVAFHVEPDTGFFGAGSVLYFPSEGASLNPYGAEAVYELSQGEGGVQMEVKQAFPARAPVNRYRAVGRWEENRTYQAGLLDAEDLWQWEAIASRWTRSYPFTLGGLAEGGEAPVLTVWLQGGSDFEADPDHHVRISVNGALVVEVTWDGLRPKRVEVELPSGRLQEGVNQLQVENAGDTSAAYSVVYLDKFSLAYPRQLLTESGQLRGDFAESGLARVSDLGADAVVLDTTDATPLWLARSSSTTRGLSFPAEAGRSYWAGEAVSPEVRRPRHPGLKLASNRAEYLVLGPRALLPEAHPLLARRAGQGLTVRAVAIEDVWEDFGHGEGRPEAVREFLSYAYHRWSAPSLRYVLLLGDATYDFKDYHKTGQVNQVPPLMVKTEYLWTASDPLYAAVNGLDALPDIAIGRLSARTVAEARILVNKILAFEESGSGLGGRAVLVADNADVAGPFEANSEAMASLLADREVEKIYLRDLGRAAMRPAIVAAFDRGSSLMSYVGHGAAAIWASENVFNIMDVRGLSPQAQQPFLMTMNCLNGYIQMPGLNSLGEELVKAEGRGAIAAFAPSGLSLDAAAHIYQRALVSELASGRHPRLGDAILAAQAAYTDSDAMPELLAIYHLLGDPALSLR